MSVLRRRSIPFALCLGLAGCHPPQVTSYRVPKEIDAPAAPAAAETATADAGSAESASLTWTAPSTWEAKAPGAMRIASYTIPGPGGAAGDFSVTAFGGESGGELANINRWRGQVQLPPIAEADLPGATTQLSVNGLNLAVVDLGGGANRILGAIVPFGGSTWFFKLTGPDAFVEQQRGAFADFLQTVRPSAPAPKSDSGAPVAAAASGATPSMADTPVPVAQGAGLKWRAPADWKSKPASAMRKATYEVDGPEGAADLSITAFPTDTGGELANVNRWRGQAGLSPVDDAGLEKTLTRMEQNGLRIAVVDAGGAGPNRILGAMVPLQDGSWWFFKLSGPEALVAREKPAFLDFLKTVQPAAAP